MLVATVLLVAAAAYFYFNPRSALQLVVPDLEKVSNMEVEIKNDTAYITLYCILKNKAPYKIHIDSIYFNIRLDTVTVVTEKQYINFVHQSGGEDTLALHARLPIKKVRKTIESLDGVDSTSITGDFKIYYDNVFGKTQLDYSKKWDIKVPVPPKIKIIKIQKQEIKLFKKEAVAYAYVQVINASQTLSLSLSGISYNISLGEDITGSGNTGQTVTIKPQTTITVQLPLLLEVKKPLKTSLAILLDKDRMNYTIHLRAILNTPKISGIPVELTAVGMAELVK